MKLVHSLSLKLIIPACATLLLTAACDRSTPAAATDTSKTVLVQLAGQSWKLDRWVGADGAEREAGAITLSVGDNFHLSGNASVNRYMGDAKFSDSGELELGDGLATTMMMGLPEAMEREKFYLADLKQARAARLENGRLILSGSGRLRLEYAPAP